VIKTLHPVFVQASVYVYGFLAMNSDHQYDIEKSWPPLFFFRFHNNFFTGWGR